MFSNRTFRAASVALLVSVNASCSLHFNAQTLGIQASVAEPAGNPVQGEQFEVSRKAVFLLWGILPVAKPSLENALAGQLIDGDEVAGLRVHVRSRFSDLLVTALTLGVIVPRSVTFSGKVVKNNP